MILLFYPSNFVATVMILVVDAMVLNGAGADAVVGVGVVVDAVPSAAAIFAVLKTVVSEGVSSPVEGSEVEVATIICGKGDERVY